MNYNDEYSEELFEMASVRARNNSDANILLCVNPDIKKVGDAYFKMYDSSNVASSNKVWRIRFKEASFIKEHKGIIPAATEMNKKYRDILIDYLKRSSKENQNYTVWDVLKYHWNDELGLCNNFNLEEYMNGSVDSVSERHPSYLPFDLEIPDYKKLI